MSMESAADRHTFAAPCLEEPPVKPHPGGLWFFTASFVAHLALLGVLWFLSSLLPPTGNGDFDGVVITLIDGKPGSGSAGEPAGAGGGSPVQGQGATPQTEAAASSPAASSWAVEPAQQQVEPTPQKQEKPAEAVAEDSRSALAIPRLAAKSRAKEVPDVSPKENPRPVTVEKPEKTTPRREQKIQPREQAHSNAAARNPEQNQPARVSPGASLGANSSAGAGSDSGAASGASQSRLQGSGLATAEGTGQGRGSGSNGPGSGAANEGQGDAGGYLKGNYEYIKKRIRQYLVYSPQAKRMGIQGLVYVAFTINRDGTAQNVELRASSGFDSLDESALEAVHRASPFAPPPQAARVVVPIQFSLK